MCASFFSYCFKLLPSMNYCILSSLKCSSNLNMPNEITHLLYILSHARLGQGPLKTSTGTFGTLVFVLLLLPVLLLNFNSVNQPLIIFASESCQKKLMKKIYSNCSICEFYFLTSIKYIENPMLYLIWLLRLVSRAS